MHRTTFTRITLIFMSLLLASCQPKQAQSEPHSTTTLAKPEVPIDASRLSTTWGQAGEHWRADSRLPWFGHSGYQFGDVALPVGREPTHNVTDFGAIANDDKDDSAAFKSALTAAAGQVLYIPEGRYIISKELIMFASNSVLRGAGQGKTVLYFPLNLEQATQSKAKAFTYKGAFLTLQGRRLNGERFSLLQSAPRGAYQLEINHDNSLTAGDFIVVQQRGNAELAAHIHGDHPTVDPEQDNQRAPVLTDWVAKVVKVQGNRVTFDRPTRHRMEPKWVSAVARWQDPIQNIGIESLTFQMSGEASAPHNQERGNNAIEVKSVAHSWIYDVEVLDADNAIKISDSRFMTLKNIHLGQNKRTTSLSGHHGIWFVSHSQENLVEDLTVSNKFIHDLSVESRSNGNVFHQSRFKALNQDHHMWAPYENLFTDLDVGDIGRLWHSGGAKSKPRGPHAAARSTSWNLRASSGRLPTLPSSTSWPQHNVIGVDSARYPISSQQPEASYETLIEAIPQLYPENLYKAQLLYKNTQR